jgi:hypothetical protein
MPASTICGGVGKSGWPMPRLMTSRPCADSSAARASTEKAVSVPKFAARVCIIYGLYNHIIILQINWSFKNCPEILWKSIFFFIQMLDDSTACLYENVLWRV